MMNSLSQEECKAYNQQGLIPGLNESSDEFIKRAQFCLNLKQELSGQVDADLPFSDDRISEGVFKEAFSKTERLYGIAPTWVPLSFSNHQLSPWHGGCAWIFQLNEETPLAAFLQLRVSFRSHASYLKLYQRDELIAHELSHVGRMAYNEPQFEEIFAYQSSDSTFRRWIGPIIQSSAESLLFIFLLGFVLIANLAILVMENGRISWLWALNLTPFLLVVTGLIRLGIRKWLMHRCYKNLIALTSSSRLAKHLFYRLTDKEIRSFAFQSSEQIRSFIDRQAEKSFRWSFIKACYPIDPAR